MRLADFRCALEVAQQSATFAETANDPASLLISDFMLGTAHHYVGDQAAAQFYVERGMARAAELDTLIPDFFGFDHRAIPLSASHAPCGCGVFPIRRAVLRRAPSMKR